MKEIYDSLRTSKVDTMQLINEVQSQLKIEGLIHSFVLAVYAKHRGAISNSDIIKILAPILNEKKLFYDEGFRNGTLLTIVCILGDLRGITFFEKYLTSKQ